MYLSIGSSSVSLHVLWGPDYAPRGRDIQSVNRSGFSGASFPERMGSMSTANRYSPEVREWAVRLVWEYRDEYDSEWAAIGSIAAKFGCSTETLRNWVRRAERDSSNVPV